MTRPTLYLLPDTNFFIHCRSLDEIDWSEMQGYSEIHIIVSIPVVSEVDRHKSKGNERVGRRCRKWNQKFRELLDEGSQYRLVQDRAPRVLWIIDYTLSPSKELNEILDYNRVDDQLVGCASSLNTQKHTKDAYLLTNDTGVMLSAKRVNVPCKFIPSGWLLPPEKSELERENEKLKSEIKLLKDTEPNISLYGTDGDSRVSELNFNNVEYSKLSADSITELMAFLQHTCPMVMDFGAESSSKGIGKSIGYTLVEVYHHYIPPTEQSILNYQEKLYPAWLQECEAIFGELHVRLTGLLPPLYFSFCGVNSGTRPANNVRITITTKGNFHLECIPVVPIEDSLSQSEQEKGPIKLPPPPSAPKGHRNYMTHALESITSSMSEFVSSTTIAAFQHPLEKLPTPHVPPPHDRHAFYFSTQKYPAKEMVLQCDQWLHGDDAKVFDGVICFENGTTTEKGVIECLLQAENLSIPLRSRIVVKYDCKVNSTFDYAQNMIKSLL